MGRPKTKLARLEGAARASPLNWPHSTSSIAPWLAKHLRKKESQPTRLEKDDHRRPMRQVILSVGRRGRRNRNGSMNTWSQSRSRLGFTTGLPDQWEKVSAIRAASFSQPLRTHRVLEQRYRAQLDSMTSWEGQ